jgi:hypothetical protein
VQGYTSLQEMWSREFHEGVLMWLVARLVKDRETLAAALQMTIECVNELLRTSGVLELPARRDR